MPSFTLPYANGYTSPYSRTLSPITLVKSTSGKYKINWSANTPANTFITIESNVSLDGGTTWVGWKLAENGKDIADIDGTVDVKLQIRQTLETSDPTRTPELLYMDVVLDESTELNVRETWQSDTKVLAKFVNSLEAGNIENSGKKIIKFRILRRLVGQGQLDDIQLGDVEIDPNVKDIDLSYTDSTQPNTKLVYSIIPVSEDGLDGAPKEIELESSDFTGYWIVDKDTNEVLSFDKAIGELGNVDTQLNQDRVVLESFSKFPQIYYMPKEYHQFTLTSAFIPEEWERSGDVYLNILNKFIRNHKPFIVKSGNGNIFVADISNIRTSSPLNAWTGHDFSTISIDITEVSDYVQFMKGW
jgi:hypothetical protein